MASKTKTKSKVNYTFDSKKEAASQYNSRIAKERGDSASSLSSMQKTTSKTFKDAGLDANKTMRAIPADTMGKTKPADIPTPSITDPGDITGANNMGISSMLGDYGITYADGKFSAPTVEDESTDLFSKFMEAQNKAFSEQESSESIVAQLEKANDIKKKTQTVNSLTGQLNSIVAKSQADQLRLEGQGRGVTDVIIGGQQAQINREAAIAALPIQAQLMAAQGDLTAAQAHVDKLFAIKSQDAQAKYQYKSSMINAVFNFANQQQQNKLTELRRQEDRKWQMEDRNLQMANQWAGIAFENRQSGLASQLMGLDPKAPDFASRFASIQGQVQKYVEPKAPVQRDTQVVDGQLIDMQTGEVISTIGGTVTSAKQTQINEALALAKELRNANAVGKKAAVGASLQKLLLGARSLGLQPGRSAYEAKVDTLKSNLTLDNLSLLKGAMSDKDLAFLQSVGSSLDTNMSEKQFDGELDRIITKLENSGATGPTVNEGAKHYYNGVTYMVVNGEWVPQ